MKEKTLFIAEALPGSGKSTKFIQSIPQLIIDNNIVYAMPTNKLIKELALDINVKAGIASSIVINSEVVLHTL
ncbi:hypothetical protein [Pseudomonas sp. RGM 3321]|uniref:hypothetical protein n=1 Tax=Pseudomonas sp. RGM 3321 TaxID=2930089 RepID=UPI001FCBE7EE|nr:hypothetical protein [Pseudomonas sp. RGM 3321]MCJ2369795.1 hypothetical protein [Pseudomonas sp. RGM 3321]